MMPNIKFKNMNDTGRGLHIINVTSRSTTWSKGLSPFYLGPIKLWGGYVSANMENAWQYSKVYWRHSQSYWSWLEWAETGWRNKHAVRYPMGRGAIPKFSWWDGDKLSYVEARKRIYAPLYAAAVEKTMAYTLLQEMYRQKKETLVLKDFDVYGLENESYEDIINDPDKKCGHGFILGMMLENQRVWE